MTIEGLARDDQRTFGGDVDLPTLDALAGEGVSLSNAWSVAPLARPALASVMTGLAPPRHGVQDNVRSRLSEDAHTLAEVFSDAGWKTVALSGSTFAGYGSGLEQGFGLFSAPTSMSFGPSAYLPGVKPAAELAAELGIWLRSIEASERAFVWLHFSDFVVARLQSGQGGESPSSSAPAAAVDGALSAIQRLLNERGGENSFDLVVVGTHGFRELKGSGAADSYWLADDTLGISVVFGGEIGKDLRRSVGPADPVWLPDVAVTVARRAGGVPFPDSDGRALGTAAAAGSRDIRAWTHAPEDEFGWPRLEGRLAGGRWETTALGPTGLPDPVGQDVLVPRGVRDALGTVGVRFDAAASFPLDRPTDDEARVGDLWRIRQSLLAMTALPALKQSRRYLDSHPDDLSALVARLYVAVVTSRPGEYDDLASRLLSRYPGRYDALHWVAHAELARQRRARARVLLDAVVALGGGDADVHYDLACLNSLDSKFEDSLRELRTSFRLGFRNWEWVEQDPDLANVRSDPRFTELIREFRR